MNIKFNLCVLQYTQKGSETRPAPYSTDTGVPFRAQSGWGVQLTTHLHVVASSPGHRHFALNRCVRKLAKSDYKLRHNSPSVRMDGFS